MVGSFDVPRGFDAYATVLASLAAAPRCYRVSARVAGTVEDLHPRFPAGLAALEPISRDEANPWTRIRRGAELLDWVARPRSASV